MLKAVWGDTHVGEAVLKSCVNEIRRVLGDKTESPRFIETVPRRGYRFLRSAGVGNLPRPLTNFIGRKHEIPAIKREVKNGRLITLHGPPDTGKSRLAIRVASELLGKMPHGAWWIDVAAVSEPARLAQTAASVLGVRDEANTVLADTLVDALQARSLLLVFDNCEHLAETCAALINRLLGNCPTLAILATSREPLRVPGETVWSVPPLSTPDMSAPAADILTSEAVRLFIDRAEACSPSFTASNGGTAKAVAKICQRLDGLPLGIELAAARVRSLAEEEIAARLDETPLLLGRGSRTAPTRHQTLTTALDWSFNLLSPGERLLFPRLSVFTGSFTLAAVESVCSGHDLETTELINLMAQLVDHSLVKVVTDSSADEARYRLLHTVRQYAREKLSPDLRTYLARRHAEFFLHVATENGPHIHGIDGEARLARLMRESDNLHGALAWAQGDRSGTEIELQMSAALWLYWMRAGQNYVGRYWLTNSLERNPDASADVRAQVLHGLGTIANAQGDLDLARRALEESVAVWRTTEGVDGLGAALNRLGAVMTSLGNLTEAERLIEESLALLRRSGSAWEVAIALRDQGEIARLQGRSADAAALFERSAAILHGIPDPWLSVLPLGNLARLLSADGEYDQAEKYWRQCLAILEPLDDNYLLGYVLEGMAQMACARGDHDRAVRLFGAVDRLREIATHDSWFEDSDDLVTGLRATLGSDAFDACWSEGRKLSRHEAVAEVTRRR